MNFSLRKVFGIKKEKKRIFSYNHLNDLHKKIDWAIRIGAMLVSIIALYLIFYKEFPVTLYLILLIVLAIIDYSTRAIFEWKFSEHPKQAILTIGEMCVIVISFFIVFYFDLFHFFKN